MKKYSSKQGSQLVKTANGYKFQISQDEWKRIGKEAGWLKSAQAIPADQSIADSQETQFAVDQAYDRGQGNKTLGYWMRDPEFANLYNSARLGNEQAKGQLQAYCKMNGVDTTSPELIEILG